MKKLLFLFLLGIVISFATFCSGNTTLFLPAVVSERGGLVKANILIEEGKGTFLNFPPFVAPDTQKSIYNAAKLAEEKAGKRCKITIIFEGEGNIQGPSGGLDIFLNLYSLLTGKKLPERIIATGAIDEEGNVLKVGGVYEKVGAAINNNYSIFIMPYPTPVEYLLLKKREGNIKFVFVRNVDEALDVLFANKTTNLSFYENLIFSRNTSLNLPENPWKVEEFKKMAEFFMKKEENLPSLPPRLEKYVNDSLILQKKLMEKSYYYSAANDAFITYVTMNALVNLEKWKERKERAQQCLENLRLNEKRENNWEYIVGAEVRKKWAEKSLERLNYIPKLEEEKYYYTLEAEYALGWCEIAQKLNKPGKGKKIDEEAYKNLSLQLIREVEDLPLPQEGRKHLQNAKELYNEGKYLAAIYEGAFARALVKKEDMNAKYTSMWARLYASQGLYTQDKTLFTLANTLEKYFSKKYLKVTYVLEVNKKILAFLLGFISGGIITWLTVKN